MIRTLGFFSGIVITGTAIVLFSDILFSNTSAMQSTPDSLPVSLPVSLADSLADSPPDSQGELSQERVEAAPPARILPPAHIMQRPATPPAAALAPAEASTTASAPTRTDPLHPAAAGELMADEAALPVGAVSAGGADQGAAGDTSTGEGTAGSGLVGNKLADELSAVDTSGPEKDPSVSATVVRQTTVPAPQPGDASWSGLAQADNPAEMADEAFDHHQPYVAGEPVPLEDSDAPIENGFDGNWFAFWTPFRSRASADGFARHLNESTGQDIQVLRLGPGEYRVAFFHQGEAERQRHLAQLETASGLRLGGEL
ncbi:MAG: hypothetical protein WBO15_00355 [Gammaproteobacteria bacterium]